MELIINNNKYQFTKNMTILQACEQININIPKFCYHEKLSIAGNCRMCLVEIEKFPKPVASCAMPISNNMKIFTNSPLIKKAREATLEFLLINHPLDCPICDQGGECDLQDQVLKYGSDSSRFYKYKRVVEDKNCGPIVKTIMTRCIHCTKCVRFINELGGFPLLGTLGRGQVTEIGFYINKFLKTEMSGNLVDLCPVGALTSKPYAYEARPWELEKKESIDFLDVVGNKTIVFYRNKQSLKKNTKEQILRILPKIDENYNEYWLSDKSRYCFDSNNYNRLSKVWIKTKNNKKTINWIDFFKNDLNFLKQLFNDINKFKYKISFFGKIGSIEEFFFFFEFSKKFNTINIDQTNLIKKNWNNNNQFKFINNYNNLEQLDLLILNNTNLRYEASILNLKVRKAIYKNNCKVFGFGLISNMNIDLNHLSNNTKNYNKFLRGKHQLSILFNNSINSLILDNDLFYENDKYLSIKFLNKIQQNIYQTIQNNNFNLIFENNYKFISNELGLSNKAQQINQKNINYILNKNQISIFNLNNNIDLINKNWLNKKKLYFFDFTTHKNFFYFNQLKKLKKLNYIAFPLKTLFEQNWSFLDMHGIKMQGLKILSSSQNNNTLLNILNILSKKLKLDLYSKKQFSSKSLIKNYPLYKYNNLFHKKNTNKYFNFSYKNYKFNNILNKNIYYKKIIPNFFSTNLLEQNSRYLLQCKYFMKLNTNFKTEY